MPLTLMAIVPIMLTLVLPMIVAIMKISERSLQTAAARVHHRWHDEPACRESCDTARRDSGQRMAGLWCLMCWQRKLLMHQNVKHETCQHDRSVKIYKYATTLSYPNSSSKREAPTLHQSDAAVAPPPPPPLPLSATVARPLLATAAAADKVSVPASVEELPVESFDIAAEWPTSRSGAIK